VLVIQHVDAGAFDFRHERIEALIVDQRRDAAKHDDVVAFLQPGLHVNRRHAAQFRVVACHVDILDAGLAQSAVDNG
jgi:hypothetical protein